MDIRKLLNESELLDLAESQLTDKRRGISEWRRMEPRTFRYASFDDLGGEMENLFMDDFRRAMGGGVSYWVSEPKYWKNLKQELLILICTDDEKYSDLRARLGTGTKKSQGTIVSLITAAVAMRVGLSVAALIPFCALLLAAVARVGTNAFCAGANLDMPIRKDIPQSKRPSRRPSSKRSR